MSASHACLQVYRPPFRFVFASAVSASVLSLWSVFAWLPNCSLASVAICVFGCLLDFILPLLI